MWLFLLVTYQLSKYHNFRTKLLYPPRQLNQLTKHTVFLFFVGEQGWRMRSGESTRPPPMWPGFKFRRRCYMWVEFVVYYLPCSERFFSGYSGFPLSSNTNTSKFQIDMGRTHTFQRVLKNS